MANLRNEFEFRSALLTALGQEHTEAEAKNEEMWRRKMLDGLGVEYDQNDVNQFGLFREKLIEGCYHKSEEGGGGSSDFSTAEVTINPIIEGSPTLVWKGFLSEIQYPEGSNSPYSGSFYDFNGNVILYKNEATMAIDSIFAEDSNGNCYKASDNPTAPTISGNATYDIDEGIFTITGDCTINITMVQYA